MCIFLISFISVQNIAFAESDLQSFSVEQKTIYVSPVGDDNNSGSIEYPVKTLDKARELARNGENSTVILREGRYELERSFVLSEPDSNVTYKAYNNEKAIITGEKKLDNSCYYPVTDENILSRILDSDAKAALYEIDMKAMRIELSKELMIGENRISGYDYGKRNPIITIDDTMGQIAKWPDVGYAPIGSFFRNGTVGKTADDCTPATLTLDNARVRLWKNADGAYIYSQWYTGWQDQSTMITEITKNNTITVDMPIKSGSISSEAVVSVYNLLEEISQSGEYYADVTQDKMYFMADSTENIGLITLYDEILDINSAENITFEGITFSGSRANGVKLTNCENVVFDRCTFGNIAQTTLLADSDCSDCGIKNSYINNVFNGIYLLGNGAFVENSVIENFGGECYTRAIAVNGNATISRNTIRNSNHMAIQFSGNNNIMEYNDISNVLQHTGDMGAIYAAQSGISGNIIRYNYFHNIYSDKQFMLSTRMIYLDLETSNVEIYNNVFEKTDGFGVCIANGDGNAVRSNVFVSVSTPVYVSGINENKTFNMSSNVFLDCISKNVNLSGGTSADDIVGYKTNYTANSPEIFEAFGSGNFKIDEQLKPVGILDDFTEVSIHKCGSELASPPVMEPYDISLGGELIENKLWKGDLKEFTVKTNTLYEYSAMVKAHEDMKYCKINLCDESVQTVYSFDKKIYSIYDIDGYLTSGHTDISRMEWTTFKRYIYVPSDTETLKKISIGIYSASAAPKLYVKNITLAEAKADKFKAEFTSGDEKINACDGAVSDYSADLIFDGYVMKCAKSANTECVYSITKETDGVAIDSSTGKLSVDKGVQADIVVKAEIKLGNIKKTIYKPVKVYSYEKPVISKAEGIADFNSDKLSYYDLSADELKNIKVMSNGNDKSERFEGVLTLVRVTIEKNEEKKIYNFYADNYDKNANMLYDGGFEKGVISELTTNGTAVISSDINGVRNGKYSALMNLGNCKSAYVNLKLQPGKIYIASLWVKLAENTETYGAFLMAEGANIYKNDLKTSYTGGVYGDNNTNAKKNVSLSKTEWRQITRIFYVDSEQKVKVGLVNYGTALKCYVDDFFIAELSDSDRLTLPLIDEKAGYIGIQTADDNKIYAYVILKGGYDGQDVKAIEAEYDKNGLFQRMNDYKITSDGVYLIEFSKQYEKQKLFLWDMLNITPLADCAV